MAIGERNLRLSLFAPQFITLIREGHILFGCGRRNDFLCRFEDMPFFRFSIEGDQVPKKQPLSGAAPSQAPPADPMLTARQFATQPSISPTAVHQLCDSARLPHYREDNGKKRQPYRIKQSEVVAFLERLEAWHIPVVVEPKVRSFRQLQGLSAGGYSCLRAAGLDD